MRYTLTIPDKLAGVFQAIARDEQITQSELMRKALLTYAVLHKAVSGGSTVSIIKDGVIEKEVILASLAG